MRRTSTSHIPSRAIRLLVPCIAGVLALLTNTGAQNSALMPLTLPQAIDLALRQNRDLKLAQLSVVDTEHKKEIARSAYLPHISNNSGVLHITDLEGVEIPAGAFGNHPGTGAIPGNNLFIDQGGTTWYVSGTSLDQPFTQMFKIHESNRSATADINTARIHVRQTQDEVALQARQLYYGILIAQLREQAANEEVSADEVKIQESTGQVERGQALDVTILQNRASSLEAKQSALVEKLQIRDLTIQLNDLLGLPLTTQLQLDADTPSTPHHSHP
jgi:outer membrane protein TolC